jgi:hypothetical protein
LSGGKNPENAGSFAAIKRAAKMERQIAIQTGTGLVRHKNGQIIEVSPEDLLKEIEIEHAQKPSLFHRVAINECCGASNRASKSPDQTDKKPPADGEFALQRWCSRLNPFDRCGLSNALAKRAQKLSNCRSSGQASHVCCCPRRIIPSLFFLSLATPCAAFAIMPWIGIAIGTISRAIGVKGSGKQPKSPSAFNLGI